MDSSISMRFLSRPLVWLTGPIFDKELRVSSRRKRNYALRTAYLLVLLFVTVLIWADNVHTSNSNAYYQISRMAQAGVTITGISIAVQFILAQIIAVVMLSNSVSEEVYSRTLGVLMSTPISALQIVTGKLLGKLLQVILLLCLTLPILGIIRIFGGIPWVFLLQSFCITLTTVIFAGILTLNISIHQKHAYIVIIQAILGLTSLFIVIPLFFAWIAIEYGGLDKLNLIYQFIMIINPYFLMEILFTDLFSPGGIPFSTENFWIWHCLFMLICSGLLFSRAVIVVRKKALLQASGRLDISAKNKRLLRKSKKIRRVKGPPVLWKELRNTALKMSSVKKCIAFLIISASLLGSYYIFNKESFLDEEGCHIMYAMIFSILSLFMTATFSATTITSEKISQTWPVLLCTLVSDRQIIWAKVIGAVRRSIPFWSLLILHVIIFSGIFPQYHYIHLATLPLYIIIVTFLVFFTISSGILFSSLFKHTTSAVLVNLIFIGVLWIGIPFLAALVGDIMNASQYLAEATLMVNPLYFLGEILNDTAGKSDAIKPLRQLSYSWEMGSNMNFIEIVFYLQVIGSVYIAGGLVFLKIAKSQLRKKIV